MGCRHRFFWSFSVFSAGSPEPQVFKAQTHTRTTKERINHAGAERREGKKQNATKKLKVEREKEIVSITLSS
jgi:hypothetical protein